MFATLLGITGGGAPPRRDFVPGRDSAGDTGKKSSDTDHDSDAEGGQSPFSDEYFYKYLKETTTLTQASKKIYMNQIKKIQTAFWPHKVSIWFVLNHPAEFRTHLESYAKRTRGRLGSDHLSVATTSQFVRIMMSLLTQIQEVREASQPLIKEWKLMKAEAVEPLTKHYVTGEMTPRQSQAFMDLEDVIKVRDHLTDGSDEKLLLSLYTTINPARANYVAVRLYKQVPRQVPADQNYIVLPDSRLVLQKFKTSKSYPTIVIDLPPQLMTQLIISLEQCPRDYLFVTKDGSPYESANAWTIWANRTLRRILNNQTITLTTFRHMVITHKNATALPYEERKELARTMGHSLESQSKYQFKKID